jgi:hypothetical protein
MAASGAGHWGLLVGSPGFKPMTVDRDARQWKPGIFFFENSH